MQSRILRFKSMPMFCDHENLRIVTVLHGECDVKRFSSCSHFVEQDVFFVNAHQFCSLSSEEGCVAEMTCVSLDALEQAGVDYSALETVDSVSSQDQTKEISLVYRDCAFLMNLLRSSGVIECEESEEILLDKMISALLTDYNCLSYEKDMYRNVNEAGMARYYRIVRYIREHMAEKLTLQSAAEAEGMQKNYFALLFKQMSGRTFLECVNRIRLMQAEEILLSENTSNQDIIRRCGFTDSKYFYKYFQEEFHVTPVSWRNRWKSDAVYDCEELTAEEAEPYVRGVYEELTSINTNTQFYKQYCLLKELEDAGVSQTGWEIELDLYHPGNILRVDGVSVNTWYGFDLIMGYVKKHDLQVVLKINGEEISEFCEDLKNQMRKSADRYDTSVLHNWRFEIALHHAGDAEEAEQLKKELQSILPNMECRMTC